MHGPGAVAPWPTTQVHEGPSMEVVPTLEPSRTFPVQYRKILKFSGNPKIDFPYMKLYLRTIPEAPRDVSDPIRDSELSSDSPL